ncbi:unnamed protein product [Paramecium pentaurelia]|uniref:Uncharacterized protein n=1 Tax=Paramecium pentaurelia TaxID=43138 RepID=A0A8S1YKU6_9CILI|nr:unnamed protein product [Paramecium pentaurelia]
MITYLFKFIFYRNRKCKLEVLKLINQIKKQLEFASILIVNIKDPIVILYNINLAQFPKQGLSQIDNIIKGLCLIELSENQFQQSIEEFKQIVKEILQIRTIKQNSIKQENVCFAIAINKDNSIVVADCDKQIKVFELKESKLNQLQLLSEHQLHVQTLNFMKKNESLFIWK